MMWWCRIVPILFHRERRSWPFLGSEVAGVTPGIGQTDTALTVIPVVGQTTGKAEHGAVRGAKGIARHRGAGPSRPSLRAGRAGVGFRANGVRRVHPSDP